MYEHDFLEVEDVVAVREWLATLSDIGYIFPQPSYPYSNRTEHEHSFAPMRVQPTLSGQPYRAVPYFNVDEHGRTYEQYVKKHGETKDGWSEWFSSSVAFGKSEHDGNHRSDNSAVVKLILMTMNEWPLIKTWVMVSLRILFHP